MDIRTVFTIIVAVLAAGTAVFPIIEIHKFYSKNPRDLKQGAKTFGAVCIFVAAILVALIVISLINRS